MEIKAGLLAYVGNRYWSRGTIYSEAGSLRIGAGVKYSGHRVRQGSAVLGTGTRATGGLGAESVAKQHRSRDGKGTHE